MSADEGWFPEPFGPVYERPPGEDCPCCTRRLCETAAGQEGICSHMSDAPQAVSGCPCTATSEARARTRAAAEEERTG